METLLMPMSVDQCVARQRELEKQLAETKDKPQRELLKVELQAVLERMRVLKAERKAKAVADAKAAKVSRSPTVPKSQPPPFTAVEPSTNIEVIRLRRPSRTPSRPPEAVPPIPREPRPFADLRAGIAEEMRRR